MDFLIKKGLKKGIVDLLSSPDFPEFLHIIQTGPANKKLRKRRIINKRSPFKIKNKPSTGRILTEV